MSESILANLLTESEQALCAVLPPSGGASPRAAETYRYEDFDQGRTSAATGNDRLELRIELGRARMNIGDVRKLRRDSVVPLDAPAGGPVSVYSGGRRVGRGELLTLDGKIAVRLVDVSET